LPQPMTHADEETTTFIHRMHYSNPAYELSYQPSIRFPFP
jgi:hypothetical protein